MENKTELNDRQLVAKLIVFVITGKLLVREALEKFPESYEDDSISTAWHALVHYESDEDIRKRDYEFAEEQNTYLYDIAMLLEKGDSLPLNIINSYKPYYESGSLKSPKKLINKIKQIFRWIV